MSGTGALGQAGAACFGIAVGYLTYLTLVRTAGNASVCVMAAAVGAVGGAAVTGLFGPGTSVFAGYAIGLLAGLAAGDRGRRQGGARRGRPGRAGPVPAGRRRPYPHGRPRGAGAGDPARAAGTGRYFLWAGLIEPTSPSFSSLMPALNSSVRVPPVVAVPKVSAHRSSMLIGLPC